MELFIIILLSFFILLATILWLPIVIEASSTRNYYGVKIPFIFTVKYEHGIDKFPGIYILGFRIKFKSKDMFHKFQKNVINNEPAKPKKKRNKGLQPKKVVGIISSVAKSFRIKRFNINIDTGDFVLNSYLYPIPQFISHPKINVNINYENQVDIDAKVFTRMYNLVFITIKNIITN
ncbi:MAG: hypothetical protein MI922_17090 [Bacteroidales bacterium]|nr:hypothetical protein [Bacteroidales bacterium]